MELDQRLSLVIETCGAFSDIWLASSSLVVKNWPLSSDSVFYVTDTGDISLLGPSFHVVRCGQGAEYSKRLGIILERIKTKYLVLLLDDFFLTRPIELNKLNQVLDAMDELNADYVHFDRNAHCKYKKINCTHGLYKNLAECTYGVNLCPAIWKTDSLKKIVTGNENAWTFEVMAWKRSSSLGLSLFYTDENAIPYLDGIRKGRFLPKAKRYLKKNGLLSGSRKTIGFLAMQKLNAISFLGKVLPVKFAIWLKKNLRKKGYHFYSDDAQNDSSRQ